MLGVCVEEAGSLQRGRIERSPSWHARVMNGAKVKLRNQCGSHLPPREGIKRVRVVNESVGWKQFAAAFELYEHPRFPGKGREPGTLCVAAPPEAAAKLV